MELAVWESTADYSQPGEAFCIDLDGIPVSTEKIELVVSGGWAEETDGAFGEPCASAVRTIEMQSLPRNVSCSQGPEACLGIDDIGLLCNQSVYLCLDDYQYASTVCGITGDQMCRTGFRSVLEFCSENVEIEFGK